VAHLFRGTKERYSVSVQFPHGFQENLSIFDRFADPDGIACARALANKMEWSLSRPEAIAVDRQRARPTEDERRETSKIEQVTLVARLTKLGMA